MHGYTNCLPNRISPLIFPYILTAHGNLSTFWVPRRRATHQVLWKCTGQRMTADKKRADSRITRQECKLNKRLNITLRCQTPVDQVRTANCADNGGLKYSIFKQSNETSSADTSTQCDLTRPECVRCARRHVACPGYRNEVDMIFRNENLSTLTIRASRNDRNKSPSSTAVSNIRPDRLEPQSELSQGRRLATEPAIAIARPLTYASTTEVEDLPLMLDHFSFSPGWQRHDSSMSFLTLIVQRSAEDSALIYSCRAAARAYFSNRLGTIENRSKALAAYSKALAATNAVLQDQKACSRDDTALASVWLLGLREVCSKKSPHDNLR